MTPGCWEGSHKPRWCIVTYSEDSEQLCGWLAASRDLRDLQQLLMNLLQRIHSLLQFNIFRWQLSLLDPASVTAGVGYGAAAHGGGFP